MVENGKISVYRERLDETLASTNLTDENKLKTLVKDHMLRSSYDKSTDYEYDDTFIETRTIEVSNIIEMLRSASEKYNVPSLDNHHASWKLKQDNEDFRVMYREGPVGSPFHSLLVEGYIDAPLDACLSVTWETALYPRWFPQTLVPTFKVTVAKTLKKIRIGEQLSLVRMKLSWPLSNREAVFHYFEFEYFEGDLLVVLLSTPDLDNIQMKTHGFTNEGVPAADGAVRVDAVGGLALQKVTENRSYFRTIANLDVKLDFVPPSLINFISRQLIGSGFRFYKKTVASVSYGDEDFSKVWNDPLYTRIRKALCSINKSERNLQKEFKDEEHKVVVENIFRKEELRVVGLDHGDKFSDSYSTISNKIGEEMKESKGHQSGCSLQCKPASEIEEEMKRSKKGKVISCKEDANVDCVLGNQPQFVNIQEDMPVPISPQVEKALGTLDKLISIVRENRLKHLSCSDSGHETRGGESISTLGKHLRLVDKQDSLIQEIVGADIIADDMSSENSTFLPLEAPSYVNFKPNLEIGNWSKSALSPGNHCVGVASINTEANAIHENNNATRQQKKWRLCCFDVLQRR